MSFLWLLFLISSAESLSVSYFPKTRTPPSPHEVAGLAYDSTSRKVYIYGGRSEIKHIDMWEFDLATQMWNEIQPATPLNPGARSDTFITILEKARQLVLFGGDAEGGPTSDIWVFDLDSETVIFTQWRTIDTKGKAPPRAYYRAVCKYSKDGKQYIAVYGGIGIRSNLRTLHILDIETFTWTELPSLGEAPEVLNQKMEYYNESLYLFTGTYLYKYDFRSGIWTRIEPVGKRLNNVTDNSLCRYKDDLYSILGWDTNVEIPIYSIYKINLSQGAYQMEEISIAKEDMAEWSFGYDCKDSIMYLFGGGSLAGYYNTLAELDLSQSVLHFEIISEPMNVPTGRRGHAMEAYDDKLYIFGGVDKYGNSVIDMWAFDIREENWSSIPLKSSIVPSPRSEFAHARYQDSIIIYGGKGEQDLFNDLYLYSIVKNEWELISTNSSPKPSARRAACLAVYDDFFLIFGGVESSGYNNELWKYEWATYSYTLLDSRGAPPASAFSQCHIELNPNSEMIFKVYMGENDGESPIAFIYEYSLATNKWNAIQELSYDYRIARSKAATFMIKDNLIVAGGSLWNYWAREYIDILNISTGEVKRSSYLPENIYYGASTYYKNKIYIHGGGDNFGALPLKNMVKNDLVVIELDKECDPHPNMCISECSLGTYSKAGSCQLCPAGSYSYEIGSDSCFLCSAGYFSEVIGAETERACKPCPYGYFNDKEGQTMCYNCPIGSICSFDQVRPEIPNEIPRYISNQPELLEYNTHIVEETSGYFNIVIGIMLGIFLVPILISSANRELIRKIDIYSLRHNYEENKAMYIRKTLIGAVFTAVFAFGALAVAFNMLLSYAIDNIRENKALVPLAALEQKYDSVIFIQILAKDAYIEFYLTNYGAECLNNEGECTEYIELTFDSIEMRSKQISCAKVRLDCRVSLRFTDFELAGVASIKLKLFESESFSSGIVLKVETSSSIPGEVSSIENVIWSDPYQYFRGSDPTIFTYLMTPSLFTTDTTEWDSEETGYHISVLQDIVKGSQVNLAK